MGLQAVVIFICNPKSAGPNCGGSNKEPASMDQDYMSRGYLLPPGCKDLIDVLKLKPMQSLSLPRTELLGDLMKLKSKLSAQQFEILLGSLKNFKAQLIKFDPKQPSPKQAAAQPPIVGQIVVPAETTALQLASLLGQKPLSIVADVAELGFFIFPSDSLSFEIISSVARKYGYMAIRAAA